MACAAVLVLCGVIVTVAPAGPSPTGLTAVTLNSYLWAGISNPARCVVVVAAVGKRAKLVWPAVTSR